MFLPQLIEARKFIGGHRIVPGNKESPPQPGSVSQGDYASDNITNTGHVGGHVIGRDQIIHNYQATDPTVKALHQLPSPPADFTGREIEMAELQKRIEET